MNEHLYQLILEYKMSREEALTLRLADIYIELSHKYFPEYKHAALPKSGDPRKGLLFKYCWKLLHETKDKIKVTDYPNFIQSQLSILKNYENAYINPNCLIGDKAWSRWCVWSKYFNEMKKTSEAVVNQEDFTKEIKKALDETHYVLTVRLGELTKNKVLSEMETILRWVRMAVVSPIFIAMSPTAESYIEEHKPALGFELPKGVESMQVYYQNLFKDV